MKRNKDYDVAEWMDRSKLFTKQEAEELVQRINDPDNKELLCIATNRTCTRLECNNYIPPNIVIDEELPVIYWVSKPRCKDNLLKELYDDKN